MTVFVDMSALSALVVAEDGNHAAARTRLAGLLARRERLRTTDYGWSSRPRCPNAATVSAPHGRS